MFRFGKPVIGALTGLAFIFSMHSASGQDSRFSPTGQQIPTPPCLDRHEIWQGTPPVCTDQTHVDWLKDIQHWRTERLIRVGYNGSRYSNPAFQWIQSSFLQPQMMVEDRYFYDPVKGEYTVGRYLDDLEQRYGGIDAVLIWPTYPNMGIDDRNQHDMIRSMPGGLAGVRKMVSDFHKRGVRVLFPMMMWDQGTHDPGQSWPDAIADVMKEIGADGINGDTQDGVPVAFSLAADAVQHPLVFQPEGGPHDEALAWNVMTWGQYSYPFVPQVDRYKWMEPRHMVNISDRWNRKKTDNLQFAFFNGVGWESWENIWGIWNGITPRDAEATRRVVAIERGIAPFLTSKDWEPLAPMLNYGVFASRWPLGDEAVWTIVNRNDYPLSGRQLTVPAQKNMRYFDLYHGTELKAEAEGGSYVISFAIEGHGFGAVLATPREPSGKVAALMSRMKTVTSKPLAEFSSEWKALPQSIVEIPATRTSRETPEGMVPIQGGHYVFKVEGIEIEGRNETGVDVQYPWEESARRFHEHDVDIKPFFIDVYPVTNAEFERFLNATQYHPADDLNFLHDWRNGKIPQGWENKPVTWVSLEDARAYAKWAGKRLPHEWEWQLASQGRDGRMYPWGNQWNASAVPTPNLSRSLSAPDAVNAHPAGASASGVMDLIGNVWQWTDEYTDEHTRAAILRGGSYYQPQGSIWYFPQAYQNSQHGKLLLMAPSYDRSGTVGFRCVRDAEQDH